MRFPFTMVLLVGCGAEITAPSTSDTPSGADTGVPDEGGDTEDTPSDDTDPDDTGSPDTGDTQAEDPEPVDYRLPGSHSVSQLSQTVTASCAMETLVFSPSTETGAPLVVLAHGFSRTTTQLVGWAEHLASWGFPVAVPALCHSSFWDTDHEINGEDLLAVASALGADEVVYAGHSAGGLSAFVSGALDSRAIGVVGLDATDTDGLGLDYAAALTVPAYGLLGEPSDCNADCNGFDLYDATPDALAVRVTDADHCDYESDTDWMCTTFCTNASATFSDAEIQDAIRGLMTAAVFELTEGETDWWMSGTFYEALIASGQVTAL